MGYKEYACIAIWLEKFAPLRLVRNLSQLSSLTVTSVRSIVLACGCGQKADERDCAESTKNHVGRVRHYRMTFSSGPLG
ncbi:uncharacterized protein N7525_006930 [Penicillium rubens]|uniref:uncharacterized protein n=1 Tax=Penicillium rubens TaxID=1108849 RepID=UPI002974A0B9|nr:uncharacterized protein N7525_006930 [Penicillium rubens]KAJ5828677.1 hypothetical protein N7525_006930 [Penicillium rubens]KAJ5841621.1 hypothetical protein N7534_011451 [Penicillium rubens]KAJ6148079.1 hypothetical protein N7497_010061 [Penicillium chrysogenum]